MKKNVTIKDLAKMAEVSPSVVSVVLSNSSSSTRVSEKTRERILALAKEYRYTPNLAARGFQFRKSYLIGFFFSGSGDFVLMRLLEEMRSVCYEHNYDIILYPSSSMEMERRSIESARSRNLDGVITVPFASNEGNNAQEYRQFLEDGIPVVQLLYRISEEFDFSGRNYYAAGYDSVRILKDRGHRRIGLVVYDLYLDAELGRSSNEFYRGAEAAAKDLKAELQICPVSIQERFNANVCEAVSRRILALPEGRRPTALVSNSNTLLYKIYGALLRMEVQIPEEISLLGCGEDLDTSRSLLPDLSILKTPFRSIVRTAVSKVIFPDAPESQGKPEFQSPFHEGKTIQNFSTETARSGKGEQMKDETVPGAASPGKEKTESELLKHTI